MLASLAVGSALVFSLDRPEPFTGVSASIYAPQCWGYCGDMSLAPLLVVSAVHLLGVGGGFTLGVIALGQRAGRILGAVSAVVSLTALFVTLGVI